MVHDLTGNVYGKLTVIARAEGKFDKPRWVCLCSCGNTKIIRAANLTSGTTKSCGCLRSAYKGKTPTNLTGKRFGNLVALSPYKNNQGRTGWLCLCDCGNTHKASTGHLNAGMVRSCGCLHKGPIGINLVGRKIGKLLVVSEIKSSAGKGGSSWVCRCDCGAETIVKTGMLTGGGTISCGCNRSAKARERMLNQIPKCGPDHPMWNPDLTEEDRIKGRRIEGYKEWRLAVYTRDNFTCQCCGATRNFHAHHLESYADNKELRVEESNGVTLCVKCHSEFHATYGMGANTTSQFLEFIQSPLL